MHRPLDILISRNRPSLMILDGRFQRLWYETPEHLNSSCKCSTSWYFFITDCPAFRKVALLRVTYMYADLANLRLAILTNWPGLLRDYEHEKGPALQGRGKRGVRRKCRVYHSGHLAIIHEHVYFANKVRRKHLRGKIWCNNTLYGQSNSMLEQFVSLSK